VLALSPQKYGTDKLGKALGPIILVWFLTIGILGLGGISHNHAVLKAGNPFYAIRFFIDNGWYGFLALGAVFLVATGGEALYVDIGHFGRKSVNIAQFFVVLPSLALNYFGQGALLGCEGRDLFPGTGIAGFNQKTGHGPLARASLFLYIAGRPGFLNRYRRGTVRADRG
jgi:K+ transporter